MLTFQTSPTPLPRRDRFSYQQNNIFLSVLSQFLNQMPTIIPGSLGSKESNAHNPKSEAMATCGDCLCSVHCMASMKIWKSWWHWHWLCSQMSFMWCDNNALPLGHISKKTLKGKHKQKPLKTQNIKEIGTVSTAQHPVSKSVSHWLWPKCDFLSPPYTTYSSFCLCKTMARIPKEIR